jgi:hypothetical protein
MEKFTKTDIEKIRIGVRMYRDNLKKMLTQSQNLHAGEKEIKKEFLETERLLDNLAQM